MLSGDELSCGRLGCATEGGPIGTSVPPRSVRIGKRYTGWRLYALDARIGDDFSGLVGYSQLGIPPWALSATVVRSAPHGPVRAQRRPAP